LRNFLPLEVEACAGGRSRNPITLHGLSDGSIDLLIEECFQLAAASRLHLR